MGRYSGSCKQIGPEIVNNIETLIVNKPRITSKKVPKTDYSSPDSQNLGSSMVLLIGVVNRKISIREYFVELLVNCPVELDNSTRSC